MDSSPSSPLMDALGKIAEKYPDNSPEIAVLATAAKALYFIELMGKYPDFETFLAFSEQALSPEELQFLEDQGLA
jgi:hypothetical protein